MEQVAKIEWSITSLPAKEIFGACRECGAELVRVEYSGYHDYNNKLSRLKKRYKSCPKCAEKNAPKRAKKSGPKWKRLGNGDWIAECKEGDFLVWKFGSAYRWRYRRYGKDYADLRGQSYTRAKAQEACERCKQWQSKQEGGAA